MSLIKEFVYRLRGEYTTEKLIKMGMKVGNNFGRLNGVILDPSHCWLIEIGNNVTLAPRVHVLCHDASTKYSLGYTKIGRVNIGAHSTVTHDIEENSVVVGTPAKKIMTYDDYIKKERETMKNAPIYGEEYTLRKNVSLDLRLKQKKELLQKKGYID